jgi:hypothetical protein
MATVKRLNSTYTIDTTDVYITGNLHVTGVYDTQLITTTITRDANLALNVGNTAPVTSGLYIDRFNSGTGPNVAIRWNESYSKWEITNDGSTYSNVLTTAGGLSAVVDDTSPELGGNLLTNSFNIQFNAPTYVPTGTTGNVNLFGGNVGGGMTGLYVVNQTVASQELITKTRAFGYSLLL